MAADNYAAHAYLDGTAWLPVDRSGSVDLAAEQIGFTLISAGFRRISFSAPGQLRASDCRLLPGDFVAGLLTMQSSRRRHYAKSLWATRKRLTLRYLRHCYCFPSIAEQGRSNSQAVLNR